jgi:predicted nucleic-acid-binding Zn-ribbon protein
MECGYIETYLAKVSFEFIDALKKRFPIQEEKAIVKLNIVNPNDEELGMKSGTCSKCGSNGVRIFTNRSKILGNIKKYMLMIIAV